MGDGISAGVVAIEPDGRSKRASSTCFEQEHDEGQAAWELDSSQLRVKWDTSTTAATRPDSLFYVLAWSDRVYLVQDMIGFINRVNDGEEPRTSRGGSEYLRSEDWTKPVNGAPTMPGQFVRLIHLKPLRGIVRSTDFKTGTVDLGSADGVSEGMIIYTREAGFQWRLEITSVGEHQSRVRPALNGSVPSAAHVSTRRNDPLTRE